MKNERESDFKVKLCLEAKKHNIELNNSMLDKFEIYKNMLIEWNNKMNLTSIVDEYQIIVKHFVDCLECIKHINENDKVIDIGTGAGFPGVVIAIYFENRLDITLLDSLNKRLIFVEEVVKVLGIKNINIMHGRAEEKAYDENLRERFDIVLARALAPLNILCEYTSPYIKIKGKCVFMKADNIQEEIDNCKKAFNILNLSMDKKRDYKLEIDTGTDIEVFTRCILEIKKQKSTPLKYPRNYGKIKKSPL